MAGMRKEKIQEHRKKMSQQTKKLANSLTLFVFPTGLCQLISKETTAHQMDNSINDTDKLTPIRVLDLKNEGESLLRHFL